GSGLTGARDPDSASHAQGVPDRPPRHGARDLFTRFPATRGHAERHPDTDARVSAFPLTRSQARCIWLRAQRLATLAPFGNGPEATLAAIRHLGYVQIDTIHVIERSHHHILFTRIPEYRREHLHRAQSIDRTVFEYWTHALSYLPLEEMRHY